MKYLILGAGPAGISVANKLKMSGEDSFIVLERESEAGGLCRSCEVDGAPFDIGGGHFLDVRRPEVNDFLFRFMPEDEWNKFDRDSRIVIGNNTVGHPIENLSHQLAAISALKCLKDLLTGFIGSRELKLLKITWFHIIRRCSDRNLINSEHIGLKSCQM